MEIVKVNKTKSIKDDKVKVCLYLKNDKYTSNDKDQITDYINANNYNLYNTYIDNDKELEFSKMLVDIELNNIKYIITYSISEFANKEKLIKYINFLKRHNRGIIFFKEDINTLYIESNSIFDSPINEDTTINNVKTEEEIVKYVYDLFLNNKNVNRIKNRLNTMQIPRINNYKCWRGSLIVSILTKKYSYISKDKYKEVLNILKNEYRPNTLVDKPNNRYAFSNHMRCGFCHNALHRNVLNYTGPYYRCVTNEKYKNNGCNNSKSIKQPIIEKVFIELINKYKYSKIIIENSIKKKIKYFDEYVKDINLKTFNEKVFDDLIHLIIFGGVNNKTHTFRFIIRTTNKKYEIPTKEELNHNYYKILEYYSEIETNWREYKTNILHTVNNMYVSLEIDMDGDF